MSIVEVHRRVQQSRVSQPATFARRCKRLREFRLLVWSSSRIRPYTAITAEKRQHLSSLVFVYSLCPLSVFGILIADLYSSRETILNRYLLQLLPHVMIDRALPVIIPIRIGSVWCREYCQLFNNRCMYVHNVTLPSIQLSLLKQKMRVANY